MDKEYCSLNYDELQIRINAVEESFAWGQERNYEKGQRFEEYAKFLLSSLRICESIYNIPTSSNQIDFRVELLPHKHHHPFFDFIGNSFIVECKNENNSISTREVADLIKLLEDYGCVFGCFLSRKNISSVGKFDDGNARRYKEYYQAKKVLIAITIDDVKLLIRTKGNFLTLLREKYREIIDEKLI